MQWLCKRASLYTWCMVPRETVSFVFSGLSGKQNLTSFPRDHTLSVLLIAPAGFWPRGQNPRRHPRVPRVYGYTYKRNIKKWNVLVVWEFSRFDETRHAQWSWVIRSGFAIFEQHYTPIIIWPALWFQRNQINSLRNGRDSDLKQIENIFKDPEEKNSSDGIVGNSEV